MNWFQMQQAQTVPLPVNYQALCEQAKKYEPGQRYSEFVCSLPKERVWLESLSQDITAPSKTGLVCTRSRALVSVRSGVGRVLFASSSGRMLNETMPLFTREFL